MIHRDLFPSTKERAGHFCISFEDRLGGLLEFQVLRHRQVLGLDEAGEIMHAWVVSDQHNEGTVAHACYLQGDGKEIHFARAVQVALTRKRDLIVEGLMEQAGRVPGTSG